jgi:hypothetical protein
VCVCVCVCVCERGVRGRQELVSVCVCVCVSASEGFEEGRSLSVCVRVCVCLRARGSRKAGACQPTTPANNRRLEQQQHMTRSRGLDGHASRATSALSY